MEYGDDRFFAGISFYIFNYLQVTFYFFDFCYKIFP